MAKTLWEMLASKVTPSMESTIDNPLKVRCGGAMSLNTIDTAGMMFTVQSMTEYRRPAGTFGGKDLTFTDYDLLARPLGKEDVRLKLRLMPTAKNQYAGMTHNVVMLKEYFRCPYNEELHNAVTAGTKLFECFDNGVLTAKYFRINDLNDPHQAKVSFLRDEDGSGKVDDDEVQISKVEYWDYWREIKDEAGQPVTDFCFVEMDRESGNFVIWTGTDVDPSRVSVL
jgi:hypothetical protein